MFHFSSLLALALRDSASGCTSLWQSMQATSPDRICST
jgi:hypothetical protein